MEKYRVFLWSMSCVGMVVLSIISLSPLAIPPGKYLPMLFGLPYSLWVGVAISLAMLLMTVLAAVSISNLAENEEI